MFDEAKKITRRAGAQFAHPVKAGVKIPRGAMVMLGATHFADNATAAENLRCVGLCAQTADNTEGGDGAVSVPTEKGVFVLPNDPANPVTRAHIGSDCYALDNEFVTSAAAGKSVAGKVVDVDATGVSVEI